MSLEGPPPPIMHELVTAWWYVAVWAAIIPYGQQFYNMSSDYAQYNPYQIHYYTVLTV